MDTRTNHLVTAEELDNLPEDVRENYEQVPDHLTLSAQLELMGKSETTVGKESSSSISEWAKSKRNKIIEKAKQRKRNKICCR